MNISGVLVSVRAEKIMDVKKAFDDLAGVEIHHETDKGQLIVTVEEPIGIADSILAVHRTDGVIAASLVYHNFEANDVENIQSKLSIQDNHVG